MKKLTRKNCRPFVQDKEFIAVFGMTSDEIMKMMTLNSPLLPCNIPKEEFLKSFGMMPEQLSNKIGVSVGKIERLISEAADDMKCSPACMLKLARMLGASDALLVNLTVKGRMS
ncbi:MAG: hypothetical protein D3909_03390 [Candidatus Electrothrix sp. ATG1]|nr:hypothetical protein [Candidatus Electrothrix sp. ATG1]